MPSTPLRPLIVLPAYNEEQALGPLLDEISEALPALDCLVVSDGSSDGTVAIARSRGVVVVDLPFNLGVGGAMRAGFRYALRNGYTAVVQVDADGQHDPRDVPRLVADLDRADIVIGARFAGAGEYSARGPRRWAMKVLASVIGRIARTKLTDATSGFKASGPKAVRLFAEMYPAEYLGDTVEALVIAARAGLRIRQSPVAMRDRQGGVPSHHPVRAAAYLARASMALIFAMTRSKVELTKAEVAQ
ncbi:glycosyltransferase family 2 protein [Agromyces italicus]|uniref:glycosyltransferase family 2 protein n=1 Tax=Agromyces italicus TaxID=279572 RepID=UPI0003B625A6|nr:glycosyltransferase family 2 protein [Agromyces italicus]